MAVTIHRHIQTHIHTHRQTKYDWKTGAKQGEWGQVVKIQLIP